MDASSRGPSTSGRAVSVEERRTREEVLRCYELLLNAPGRHEEALERFSDDYRQHSPDIAHGSAGLRTFIEQLHERRPTLRSEVRRVLVDGDFVVLHSHLREGEDDPGTAAVDIFRVQDGVVVEHWDVLQPVRAAPLNDNQMF